MRFFRLFFFRGQKRIQIWLAFRSATGCPNDFFLVKIVTRLYSRCTKKSQIFFSSCPCVKMLLSYWSIFKEGFISMHWHYDFKFVSSLVGLLYSPVTIFTGKKSLGHPVALLKANQIWFRFRPRKKRKKEKHYLCDLNFGLWYWPSQVILNSTGPLLYALWQYGLCVVFKRGVQN